MDIRNLIPEDFKRASEFDPNSLLPCPFCGATHVGANELVKNPIPHRVDHVRKSNKGLYIYDNAPSSDCQTWAHVVCLDCGAGQNSVRKWNMRRP
jgi:hypothetical protein